MHTAPCLLRFDGRAAQSRAEQREEKREEKREPEKVAEAARAKADGWERKQESAFAFNLKNMEWSALAASRRGHKPPLSELSFRTAACVRSCVR